MQRPDAPKPPVIELCGFINEGAPYFYCRFSDGSSKRWNVSAGPENSGKLVCTYSSSYANAMEYSKKFDAYVDYKLSQCENKK